MAENTHFQLSKWLVFSLIYAVLVMVNASTVAAAAAGNMLENPQLKAAKDSAASGWTYPAGLIEISSAQADRGAVTVLEIPGKVGPTLTQKVAVTPERDYLASLWVRSPGRLVLTIAGVTASYHKQGQWQQVVALINAGASKSVDYSIQLRSLTGEAVRYELCDVSMRQVQEPGTPEPRVQYDTTRLIDAGQPDAIIVANASTAMQALAKQVQQAVRDRTGVALPIALDTQVTGDTPALRDDSAGKHLILIGRLGTNRALWTAYNRFLAAADGYYPGGDGYVVRTASNVMRNGKNHIVLGGSSDAGVARAVERFVEHVGEMQNEAGGWSLPWLLDVQMQGECLAAFEKADALWQSDPMSSSLPPVEPGYGTVRRWYENAMGWYWSGWDSYRQRAVQTLEPVLEDMAYTHHYITEFMVRAYDMVDDGPLLSDAQRAGMDHLIQTNFWRMSSGPDRTWMTIFSPPYDDIDLVNRHQISPWTADMKLADFLHDYCEPAGDLGEAVAFRRSEKMAVLDNFVAHRWGPSAPGAGLTEQIEEPVAAIARYALDHDRYVFFESGNAKRSLFLDSIEHRSGLLARPAGRIDHHLIMGMLAHYHEDGRYKALLEQVPVIVHPNGHFQGRYVNEVHRWTPGPELEVASLDSFTGVRVPETMPQVKYGFHRFNGGQFEVPAGLGPDDVLDLLVMRSGFEKGDDYFALTGLRTVYPPGAIVNFTSREVYWLGVGQSAIYSPSSDRYFDQNAVHVLPTDRWLADDVRYPAAARQQWTADLHRAGGGGMMLSPFMGMAWQREVVWLEDGLFVVRDALEALEDGKYEIAVNWRPAGVPTWDGQMLTSRSGGSELRLIPLSSDLAVRQNLAAYRAGQDSEARFNLGGSAKLDKGQHVSAITVLQARYPGKEAGVTARLAGDGVAVIDREGSDLPMVLSFGQRDSESLRTDAASVLLAADRLHVIHATHVTIAGKQILKSSEPVSFAVDLAANTLRWDRLAPKANEQATLTLPGYSVSETQGELTKLTRDAGGELTTLLTEAASAMSQGQVQTPAAAAQSEGLTVADATGQWRESWRYDGLLRPGMVRGVRSAGADVVNLGGEVLLDEVRAVAGPGAYKPSVLPRVIEVAVADARGGMPSADSDAWQRIELDAKWQPNAQTGNYGKAEPDDKVYQLAKLGGVKAQYVRAENASKLIYYDQREMVGRRPMLVELHDLNGDGEKQVLVKPDIWPKFIRKRELEDDMIAVLDANGSERFQREARTIYQDVAVLDYLGDGSKQIATADLDGKINIIDAQGKTLRSLDLWQMHQSFHATKGHTNARHPAGGYTMPYAIGAWRAGANGVASLVVARYGALSFIDSAGEFEGVLMSGGYVMPSLLPGGADFDNDGTQEQLVISRGSVQIIHGNKDERVTDPKGAYYYPQIYHVDRVSEPAWSQQIDGAKVIALEILPWANVERAVLVARDNYLGILDAKSRRWMFTWPPLVKLGSVAVVDAGRNTLTVLAATDDGLLWRLRWERKLDELASFETVAMPSGVRAIAAAGEGRAALATDDGLMLLSPDGQSLTRVATGAFYDVKVMGDAQNAVVATTAAGQVVRYDHVHAE